MKPSQYSSFIFKETLIYSLFLLPFILSIAIYNYCTDYCYISSLQFYDKIYSTNKTIILAPGEVKIKRGDEKLPFVMIGEGDKNSNISGCDIFSGRWVRDYTRPMYEEWECPYIMPQLTCQKHGRPDKDYLYWRWQPHHCSIPSFNGTLMLEALRGKRMMFVGDSLNRGQYTSLICLLQRAIPDEHARTMEIVDSIHIFTAKDYNATIEFYWAPFLLESNADNPKKHRVSDRIIRNGTVDKHGQHWKVADILVFNTYIWWISGLSVLRGSFEDEVKDTVKIPMVDAYRIAMMSLVKWIDKNVDPTRTRVFFATMSPTHQWSEKWNGDYNGNCYNETRMINDPNYFAAEISLMDVAAEELNKSIVPVTFLNITQLSSSRKDAHTSIYKKHYGPRLTEEQLVDPKSYADCIHWCLPGLQDVWNELFFSKLFYP
ncbi:hypothetical protein CASFOL_023544 [Castilleja foliolosa]|uniref:Trichome birefringence-like N-terminal domain-containing protein n=1 Tax=Castilleja foliolosa TaxID=1961234 RepID=A0ABD3CKV8_9LAMI